MPTRRETRAAATPGTATYKMTYHNDWTKISAVNHGQHTAIPYTELNEFFGINMCDWEMEKMKDKNGDIRYHKIFEWMLPTFGGQDGELFWDFVAARMQSYMTHLMH